MDTEIQEWYCDVCCEKYPLKEKGEHIKSDYHDSNGEFLEHVSDYEDYRLCRASRLDRKHYSSDYSRVSWKDVERLNVNIKTYFPKKDLNLLHT